MKTFKEYVNEMMGIGGGAIAGAGIPPGPGQGEPGVHMKKRKRSPIMMKLAKRKAPK